MPTFYTATVTPLSTNDSLHVEGLESLLAQQLEAGIPGFLIGGTMGAMQLLPDETYRDLMIESVRIVDGQAELMAGAGDASLSRTLDRVRFLNSLQLDGVVVLAPYLMPFEQDELVAYYRQIADASRAPIFLYDLPGLTRTKLSIQTVLQVASHPNIAGIKCSDEPGYARQLRDLTPADFRVILAAPTLMDVFLRSGFHEHLDGVFCLCPHQVIALDKAVADQHWDEAARLQGEINRVLQLLHKFQVWRPFTALLNELGIPGHFKPAPHRDWNQSEIENFLAEKETQAVLSTLRQSTSHASAVLNGT